MKYLSIVVLLWIASCNNDGDSICNFKKIKTLYTDIGISDKDTGYVHVVLIKDFSKNCIDSTTITIIAKSYIDTVSHDKPVKEIMFYNSDKNFIKGKSQDMDRINKNCLVGIAFDYNAPSSYIFYNNRGEMIYFGRRWQPCDTCQSYKFE